MTDKPLLGVVAPNGATYFTGHINECRSFLRQHGLECEMQGWQSQDGKRRGLIDFYQGSYHAAYWAAS